MWECKIRNTSNSLRQNAMSFYGSFINHSCTPNTLLSFHDQKKPVAKLVAMRSIEKGEELLTTYLGEREAFLDTTERREALQSWNFECDCEACRTRKDDKVREVIRRIGEVVNLHSSPIWSYSLERDERKRYQDPYKLNSLRKRTFTPEEVLQQLFDLPMLLEQIGAWEYMPNCYSMVIEAFANSSDRRREEIIMYSHWKLREFMKRISTFEGQVLFGLGYPSLARPGLNMNNVLARIQGDK